MNLTVIGCSGSFPGPDSPASCYLLTDTDEDGRLWRILLDLGNGALGPLQRHLDLRDIDAVLLSHLHADHCLDLCGLYVALRYHPELAGRLPSPVLIAGPDNTLERLSAAYDLPDTTEMAAVYDLHGWFDREPLTVGPFTITPYEMEHPVQTYGLRVESGGQVLAYSGDTDACEALVELASDVDVLLAEASFIEGRDDAVRGVHLTGRRAGEAATKGGAKRLVLTHIPAWNDPSVSLQEAAAVYSGPIELARSGLEIQIGLPDGL